MERNPQVLLVDDEADFLEPVTYWLRSKGYNVLTASNGKEALEAIQRHCLDVVFLDILMPNMSGLETLRRLRQLNNTVPVVMVTAVYQNPTLFAEASALGIAGFFPKQSRLEELGHMLDTVLRLPRHPHTDNDKPRTGNASGEQVEYS